MAKKNPHAVAMAKKRSESLTEEERREIARKAAAKRWEGWQAKRPASSRKPAKRKKKD